MAGIASLLDSALVRLSRAGEQLVHVGYTDDWSVITSVSHAADDMMKSAAEVERSGLGESIAARLRATGNELQYDATLLRELRDDPMLSREIEHRATAGTAEHIDLAHRQAWDAWQALLDRGGHESIVESMAGRGTGVWDSVRGARLLRQRNPQEHAAVSEILRRGDSVPNSDVAMDFVGANGPLHAVELRHDVANVGPVRGVAKTLDQGGLQELFGSQLGERLGIAHLVPAAGGMHGGTTMIEWVPGTIAVDAGVNSAAQLEAVLRDGITHDVGALRSSDVAAHARMERQLIGVFDYVLGNSDRGNTNVIIDKAVGGVHLIDHERSGQATLETADRLVPGLTFTFQGSQLDFRENGVRTVLLDPATVEYLRSRITPDDIRQIHQRVFSPRNLAGLDLEMNPFLQKISSRDALEAMIARLEHVLDSGRYSIE